MDVNIQTLLMARDFAGTELACRLALKEDGAIPEIWFYLALSCQEQGKHEEALAALESILEVAADNPNVHSLHAAILASLKRYDDALSAAKRALDILPDSLECINNAGAICQQAGYFEQGIEFYNKALLLNSLDALANSNLATTLALAGKYIDAQTHILSALEHFPNHAELYNTLAEAYIHTGDWDKALDACDAGLRITPDLAVLHFKQGLLYSYLRQFDEANASIRRAQELQPDIAITYFAKDQLGQHDKKLLESGVNTRLVFLEKAYADLTKCDWTLWGQYPQVLVDYIALAPTAEISRSLAFRVFNRPVSPAVRLNLMRRISASVAESAESLGVKPYIYQSKVRPQLRIGYLSADFSQHPTSILTRQLYRLHDRLKFKVYAYSLVKAKSGDIYQKEIASNCDVFRDISEMSEVEIADAIHQDEIDILVDLGQYASLDGKLEVLALKPAPVQINYLAFMATTGAEFMDYALTDHYVSPETSRQDWHERLIRLPHSLYMYDSEISNLPAPTNRKEHGLPKSGIVFCCFNNDYKIEPQIFSIWMNILREVPNSVLWLLGSNSEVRANLHNQAVKQGVEKHRLIFAGKTSLDMHIQRYQLADLFLDTHWFNGHTTAVEALWQGLPVLTWCGEATSSRVAASFLNVLNLPELITHTSESYQTQAIYYANNQQARAALKDKLRANRSSSPLFHTALTVKHLELAYELVWSRHMNNLQPDDINVPAIPVLKW